jgi:hypothetical protein
MPADRDDVGCIVTGSDQLTDPRDDLGLGAARQQAVVGPLDPVVLVAERDAGRVNVSRFPSRSETRSRCHKIKLGRYQKSDSARFGTAAPSGISILLRNFKNLAASFSANLPVCSCPGNPSSAHSASSCSTYVIA